MPLAKVELDLTPGSSRIVVNGVDLSTCTQWVRVEHQAGKEIPVVALGLMAGEVHIVGDGLVELERDPAAIDETVSAFLSSVNPEELEAMASSRFGPLGGGESTGEAFLNALKEIVDGN